MTWLSVKVISGTRWMFLMHVMNRVCYTAGACAFSLYQTDVSLGTFEPRLLNWASHNRCAACRLFGKPCCKTYWTSNIESSLVKTMLYPDKPAHLSRSMYSWHFSISFIRRFDIILPSCLTTLFPLHTFKIALKCL